MKAIRVHQHGGPEVLHLEDIPDPAPASAELLVRNDAAGVNFIDVYYRMGLYPSALPRTLGQEGAGTIVAVGESVGDFTPGERVAYEGVPGAYAELITVPAAKAVKLPEAVSTTVGAAVMLQGITAHYLACSTFPLEPGQTCLIHAAAGGVGLVLVQIAKLRGARVIGTVSTAVKEDLARAMGADEIIRYEDVDFVQATRELTSGAGVHVVYDSVGATTFDKSLDALTRRGMMVLFGQSSGPVPPFDPQTLNRKGSLFLTRPTVAHHVATREELLWRANDLFTWITHGKVKVHIGASLPLAEAPDAHRMLEERRTMGKVVLRA
jgi:NADPH:quinone reductase